MKNKRGRPSKEELQDRKCLKAIEAGARLAEKSISKVMWDIGSGKILVTGNQRLDYQVIWVLHCASDLIAQEKWFGQMFENTTVNKPSLYEEPHRYLVVIEYRNFRKFVGRDIKVQEAINIFLKVPKVILLAVGGKANLPISGHWRDIHLYEDNICGVAIASEDKEFNQHSSDETLRGKPRSSKLERSLKDGKKEQIKITEREEPVFILLFSNEFGRAFVKSAMERKGTRLQYVEMYKLEPRAQELYESVRWKNDLVIRNMEQTSRAVGWKWPIEGGRQQLYKRKNKCQKLYDILYKEGFITKPKPRGKTSEKIEWLFYVRRKRADNLEVQN